MANETPERIWATEDADNGGEDRFHSTSPFRGGTEYIRADLATLPSDAVAGGEPVAFLIERLVGPGYGPARSIVDAAKYDPTQDAFWSGDAKARHLVTPLYATPSTAELDALRRDRDESARAWRKYGDDMHQRAMTAEARVAELEKADETRVRDIGRLTVERDTTRDLVIELEKARLEVKQGGVQDMLAARRVREGGKVDG